MEAKGETTGDENAIEMESNEGKQSPEDASNNGEEENPKTELLKTSENGDKEKEKVEEDGEKTGASETHEESEEHCSPRGVLDVPVTGSVSVSDHSTIIEDGSRSLEYTNLNWKKLFGQVKRRRRSVWSFSTVSLLRGSGYDPTKTSRKKSEGKSSTTAEATAEDTGVLAVAKPSWRNFSYEELRLATDDFSSDKLIGKGGHAQVYRGCLSGGQIIAVKKIVKGKNNDEDRVGDFLSELGIIAHVDHPNAAKLIGFSADGGLYLVLQFSPHGSLATVLHGDSGCEDRMGWNIRYKVAIGIAEGLQYLHCDCQKRIIHRDITASNILLSQDYVAQISDFGLAKWLPEKWAHLVVSPIEGTFGYMAPEYFMHGIVHEKIDVFAFGVLLLELMTGRRAVDSCRQSLVMWAKPLLEKNSLKEIVDPRLGESYDVAEMKCAMFTASTCIHHLPTMRPNMKKVVQLLKGENEGSYTKQNCPGGRALLLDACDLEDYSCTTYLKDLNRHMELVMDE